MTSFDWLANNNPLFRHVTTQTQPQLSLKQRIWHFSPPIALKALPEVSSSDVVITLSWDVLPLLPPMSTLVILPLLRFVDFQKFWSNNNFSRKLNILSTSLLVSLLSLVLFSSSLLSFLVTIGSKLLFSLSVSFYLELRNCYVMAQNALKRPNYHKNFRYHCRQCPRRSSCYCYSLFDIDCQKNGKEKLFGKEFGSCRNFGINFHHLLR